MKAGKTEFIYIFIYKCIYLGYHLSSSTYILMNHHFIVSLTALLQSWAVSDPLSAWFANPVQAAEVTLLKQKQVNTRWRMWERNSNPGFASWKANSPRGRVQQGRSHPSLPCWCEWWGTGESQCRQHNNESLRVRRRRGTRE